MQAPIPPQTRKKSPGTRTPIPRQRARRHRRLNRPRPWTLSRILRLPRRRISPSPTPPSRSRGVPTTSNLSLTASRVTTWSVAQRPKRRRVLGRNRRTTRLMIVMTMIGSDFFFSSRSCCLDILGGIGTGFPFVRLFNVRLGVMVFAFSSRIELTCLYCCYGSPSLGSGQMER